MFVLYMLDNETHEYATFTRSKRPRPAVMYNDESAWMVLGTVSADD